jgi:hypothetical protein
MEPVTARCFNPFRTTDAMDRCKTMQTAGASPAFARDPTSGQPPISWLIQADRDAALGAAAYPFSANLDQENNILRRRSYGQICHSDCWHAQMG